MRAVSLCKRRSLPNPRIHSGSPERAALLPDAIFSCRASLTNSLSDWPRSAAFDLTLRKRTSGISMVVFMPPILPYLQECAPAGGGAALGTGSRRSGARRHQPPDVFQVAAHVRGDDLGRAVRLQLGPLREADVGQGGHHPREVDRPFAQVVRVVLEVDLADTVLAQPADLLD